MQPIRLASHKPASPRRKCTGLGLYRSYQSDGADADQASTDHRIPESDAKGVPDRIVHPPTRTTINKGTAATMWPIVGMAVDEQLSEPNGSLLSVRERTLSTSFDVFCRSSEGASWVEPWRELRARRRRLGEQQTVLLTRPEPEQRFGPATPSRTTRKTQPQR